MKPAQRLTTVFIALLLSSAEVACGQAISGSASQRNVDPTLVREQRRRIAAFDSVVRSIKTDSSYRLWHSMLSAPDIRKAQLAMMCEDARLTDVYGKAAVVALDRMLDTLWKRDDSKLVEQMDRRLVGASPRMGRDTCGPRTGSPAPAWLRHWFVPALPELPPAPESARTP